MDNLRDNDVKYIVNRATMFQKFYGTTSTNVDPSFRERYPHLFELTDSMNLNPACVCEAILEFEGVPVEDPLILDAGAHHAEILGFANGTLDQDTFRELKANVEYHFLTRGRISRRKNKTIWKAEPTGFSRFIRTRNSGEVHFEQKDGKLLIRAKQNLKTLNKFLLFALPPGIGGTLMVSAVITGNSSSSDAAPMLIFGTIFMTVAFLISRFVKRRKQKRKNELVDLVETLQHTLERRRKGKGVSAASTATATPSGQIQIPDIELEGDEQNIDSIELNLRREQQ